MIGATYNDCAATGIRDWEAWAEGQIREWEAERAALAAKIEGLEAARQMLKAKVQIRWKAASPTA